jgi:glycosyltransferase involved in cell wall biosynthesis
MKIAVIGSKGLPPRQGGIEHHCAEIYPRMVAAGHLVDLFARSSYTGMTWRDRYEFDGVRVVSFPGSGLRGIDALASSIWGATASSLLHYDIVHFHALGPSLWTWLPRLSSSAKVVVTCHGLDWQRDKWGKASSRLILLGEQAAVRFAHHIVVVSEELQLYFLEKYGRKTTYIGNAPATYTEPDPNFSYGNSLELEKGRYILFLGRLVPEKCPELLIKAFQKLQSNGWKLVLAGGVSDTTSFTTHLRTLAMERKDIVFTGELRGKRLAEIMQSAGLFVLPSCLEGLPLALLEAMRENIPVLVSDIPVHQKLIDRDRGMLFRVNDLEDCVSKLNWAIHHSLELKAMTKNAQAYVKKYHDWSNIATDYLNVYQEITPLDNVPILDKQRQLSV